MPVSVTHRFYSIPWIRLIRWNRDSTSRPARKRPGSSIANRETTKRCCHLFPEMDEPSLESPLSRFRRVL